MKPMQYGMNHWDAVPSMSDIIEMTLLVQVHPVAHMIVDCLPLHQITRSPIGRGQLHPINLVQVRAHRRCIREMCQPHRWQHINMNQYDLPNPYEPSEENQKLRWPEHWQETAFTYTTQQIPWRRKICMNIFFKDCWMSNTPWMILATIWVKRMKKLLKMQQLKNYLVEF